VIRRYLFNAALYLRVEAALALWRIDRQTEEAVPVLIDVLRDSRSHPPIKQNAVLALGEMGPAAKAAIPALKEILYDADAHARRSAAEVLKKIDPEAAKRASGQ
jgi:HEAT repeat protein